jgi:hypothetical protein
LADIYTGLKYIATSRSVAIERDSFLYILLEQGIHVYGRQLEVLRLGLASKL